MNKYNQDRIKHPSKIDDKLFEKITQLIIIAINVLHTKGIKICSAYISKINSVKSK